MLTIIWEFIRLMQIYRLCSEENGCLQPTSPEEQLLNIVDKITMSPVHHRLPCMQHEKRKTSCLNGGVCFAVPTYKDREIGCSCPSEWEGKRCELHYIDPEIFQIHQRNIQTAQMTPVIGLVVIALFTLLSAVYVKKRYNHKRDKPKKHHIRGIKVVILERLQYQRNEFPIASKIASAVVVNESLLRKCSALYPGVTIKYAI